ncbi:MAG: chromosomal replication initiator protein DnaA, partial [Halothiobacillus sp.]|nr:chromosomal replication initiator protein DnaA [Halothiobacillus sp.]
MSTITSELWQQCIDRLSEDLPVQQINMWIRPLQAELKAENHLILWAPNRFVMDMVAQQYKSKILEQAQILLERPDLQLGLQVGSVPSEQPVDMPAAATLSSKSGASPSGVAVRVEQPVDLAESDTGSKEFVSHINKKFNFDNFVEGKSNQLARAASQQVAQNPGVGYNPLFIYGGVGLGKTHLMQAVGNAILERSPDARVVYLHSERYVQQMVSSIKNNTIEEFKNFYRSVNALLIDDIQFFAGKNRSQEEFFHTFNALIEQGQQIIMTCDRYPKEIEGLEERLKSRFGWGLTVAVEPPDLETRVAIL